MVVILVVDMVVDQVVDMEAKKWEVEEGHLQEEMVVEVGGPWRESETCDRDFWVFIRDRSSFLAPEMTFFLGIYFLIVFFWVLL